MVAGDPVKKYDMVLTLVLLAVDSLTLNKHWG